MKRILVPTDLSPLADVALNVAATLARSANAEIVLLHYLTFSLTNPALTAAPVTIGAYFDEQEADAKQKLAQLCQQPQYDDVAVLPMVVRDDAGLFHAIVQQPADLIVLGSHGASGWEEWLFGSNAEGIVRYAHGPVLVVKAGTETFAPKNAVCGIDVDEGLKRPITLPFGLNAAIRHYVYVLTPTDPRAADGVQEFMTEFSAASQLPAHPLAIRHDYTVPDGVLNYAEAVSADLIVLFTHRRKGLAHLLSGSVAEDVLNHAPMPVLVMPIT